MNKRDIDKSYNVPDEEPRIICLCGSSKFKEEMMDFAREKTLAGLIVVMPLVFPHSGDSISNQQKERLDGLHLWKIKKSAYICAICRDFYIGRSTIREMKFAYDYGKVIQVINNGGFQFSFYKCGAMQFSKMILRFCKQSQEIYKEMIADGTLKGESL